MAGMMLNWNMKKLVQSICNRLQNRFDAFIVIEGNRGCLSGDTIIRYNRGKNARQITIKKLFEKYEKAKKDSNIKKFNLLIPTYIRAFNNEEIKLHKMKDVFYQGKKLVYELTLMDGKKIKATEDHKFLTPQGWKELKDLRQGGVVLCDAPKPTKNSRKRIKLRDIRLKVEYHLHNKSSGHGDVEVHRLIYEARLNNLNFLDYLDILNNDPKISKTLKFIDPKVYSIHHKDGCHYNNSIENLQLLTKEDHSRLEGYSLYKNFSQGVPKQIKIKSIIKKTIEDVYDIECEDPYHNFVANDILVHNCGKSTFAFKLMKLVKQEMKLRGVDGYKFLPRRDLLYDRKEVIKFFHDRSRSAVGDEFVLAGFSRDFYQESQKDLIKIINTNRDHCNFFCACIPHFKALDTQIKSLTSMRITVVRRGIAIIQTPNKTIYSTDIWDEQLNQKIESDWIKNGVQKPHYSKLTTFRGFVRFSKLSEKQEAIYQKIKDDKRQILAQEGGLEDIEKKEPFDIIMDTLIEGKIKNTAMLEGMGMMQDIKPETLKRKLRRELQKLNKPTNITGYYVDEKEAKEEVKLAKRRSIDQLIDSV